MNILLLTNKVPYPANDGSSIAMASMIDGFLKNGSSVTLLSLNTRKHFKAEDQIEASKPEGLDMYKVDVNTDITAFGALFNLFSGKAYHVSRFYQSGIANQLVELLHRQTFDLVQLEGLSMAVYLELIKEHFDGPVTLRAHNIEYQIWDRHAAHLKNPLKRAYLGLQVSRLKKFELKAFSRVDALIAITEEDERGIQRLAPSVYSLAIPCGIDVDGTQPCPTNTYDSDLGYLASFDWMPNVQGVEWFLDEVWPNVMELRPETTFKLGGRHMPKAFRTIQRDGISIHPDVPNMADFVCSSRLLMVPLLAGSGMRIKIIENMALGKAQLSTSLGAEGLKVQDGQDILLADQPRDFAKRIVEALNNPGLLESIGQNARQTIEKSYGNAQLGRQLLNFYEEKLC